MGCYVLISFDRYGKGSLPCTVTEEQDTEAGAESVNELSLVHRTIGGGKLADSMALAASRPFTDVFTSVDVLVRAKDSVVFSFYSEKYLCDSRLASILIPLGDNGPL